MSFYPNPMFYILNQLVSNYFQIRHIEHSLSHNLCSRQHNFLSYRIERMYLKVEHRHLLNWMSIFESIICIFFYPNPKFYILNHLLANYFEIRHIVHCLIHNLYSRQHNFLSYQIVHKYLKFEHMFLLN